MYLIWIRFGHPMILLTSNMLSLANRAIPLISGARRTICLVGLAAPLLVPLGQPCCSQIPTFPPSHFTPSWHFHSSFWPGSSGLTHSCSQAFRAALRMLPRCLEQTNHLRLQSLASGGSRCGPPVGFFQAGAGILRKLETSSHRVLNLPNTAACL